MFAPAAAADNKPRNGFDLGYLYAADSAEVWPENWPAVELFSELAGQWRMGMQGPTALDYGPLFARMDRLRLAEAAWEQMFADVRTLESAALAQMRAT